MKFKTSNMIAGLIVLLIILWFVIGSLGNTDTKPAEQSSNKEEKKTIPSVEISTLQAKTHENFLHLHGQTEAVREVSVKAETAGLVIKTPVQEGKMIGRGTLLCQQEVDARQARLDEAKAFLRSSELQYQASQKLVERGFRSSTQNAGALAVLDGARAAVKQAEIELGNVNIKAPFKGVFEKQIAEIGDYLGPGQACGLLVDLDPLIVVGEVSETRIGQIQLSQLAKIELATGQALNGKVRYIEARANPSTRTFRVEIEVPNADAKLKAGMTATIQLLAGRVQAHFIPASVLSLNDEGMVGARYVDADRKVRFTPVQTIDEYEDGIWVTGLPERVDLIVKGQDYVNEGIEVKTQFDQNPNTSRTP